MMKDTKSKSRKLCNLLIAFVSFKKIASGNGIQAPQEYCSHSEDLVPLALRGISYLSGTVKG